LIADRFTSELLGRGRSLKSFAVATPVCRRAVTSLIADGLTNALFECSRPSNLGTARSFVKAARVCVRAATLVVVGRLPNEVFMRGCIRVCLNAGSWNRALETADCRERTFEKVRCDGICRTALVLGCAEYVVGF
jgi:hypothetical protein